MMNVVRASVAAFVSGSAVTVLARQAGAGPGVPDLGCVNIIRRHIESVDFK